MKRGLKVVALGVLLSLVASPALSWAGAPPLPRNVLAEPAAKPEEKADKPKDAEPAPSEKKPEIDNGDTAWMLVSTGLVLFMVPGLALF